MNHILRLLLIFLSVLLLAQPVSGLVILEYFHQDGCINCDVTDPIIDTLRTEYRNRVSVDTIEIDDRAGVRLLVSYGVIEIPVVVINRNKVLTFRDITPERLDAEIRLAESGAYPIPEKRRSVLDGDNPSSLAFAFILGLMTGFSPCILGSLVVVISASGGVVTIGKRERYYPLVFGAGILTAYLLATAFLLGAGITIGPDAGSRPVYFWIAGILSILIGLFQIGLFSLRGRLDRYTSPLISRFHSLPGSLLLGICFAILFAPCAMAPFLVLIQTLLLGKTLAPLAMILAFSAGILTPFIALTLFRSSVPDEQLLCYAGFVQKLGGILLIGFGIWLIITI
jgi:cytochrome c biogenesis protein CcdA